MEASVPLFWDTIQSSLEGGRVPPPAVRQLLVGLNRLGEEEWDRLGGEGLNRLGEEEWDRLGGEETNRLGEESNRLGGEEWQASNNHGPG